MFHITIVCFRFFLSKRDLFHRYSTLPISHCLSPVLSTIFFFFFAACFSSSFCRYSILWMISASYALWLFSCSHPLSEWLHVSSHLLTLRWWVQWNTCGTPQPLYEFHCDVPIISLLLTHFHHGGNSLSLSLRLTFDSSFSLTQMYSVGLFQSLSLMTILFKSLFLLFAHSSNSVRDSNSDYTLPTICFRYSIRSSTFGHQKLWSTNSSISFPISVLSLFTILIETFCLFVSFSGNQKEERTLWKTFGTVTLGKNGERSYRLTYSHLSHLSHRYTKLASQTHKV